MTTAITAIRPLFRSELNDLGLREWRDGFNFENIPSNILDKSYHVELPRGSRLNAYDPTSQDITHDVVVRVFFKGFRNVADGIDTALAKYEQILEAILAAETRIGTDIKNITFDSMQVLPLSASNDNSILLEITFNCFIILCV